MRGFAPSTRTGMSAQEAKRAIAKLQSHLRKAGDESGLLLLDGIVSRIDQLKSELKVLEDQKRELRVEVAKAKRAG